MQENSTMTFLSVAWQQIEVRQAMLRRSKTMNLQPAPSRLRRQGFPETLVLGLAPSVLALLVVSAILCGKNLSAQTHAPQRTTPAQQQQTSAQPRLAAAHARADSMQGQPAPEAIAAPPPTPPAPIWPANQPPNLARVSWDSHGLEIEAFNSSLNQILHQVAADTGAKLEGLTQDQRIFGSYGPGPCSDVLWKLLEGSGYSVLMIGDRDTDAVLEVVLSASSPASPHAATNNLNRSNSEDDDADPPPEPPRPPPTKTPFGNGDSGSPENQQQIMQDILERQQKIDQQQQNQQNNPQQ
jgi:hypothetical protein